MPATPCLDECNYLISLARRLEGAMSEDNEHLAQWYEMAEALGKSPDLESLKGESQLEQLSLDLRTIWLRYANFCSSRYLKSPPHNQMIELPSGETCSFPYDRWSRPRLLEEKASTYRTAPQGWASEHVMFGSGMGAIICLFKILHMLYEPKPGKSLHLHGIGGYFEIMEIMESSNDDMFQFRIFDDQERLCRSVEEGESQIIYIEPVYTMRGKLGVFDMDRFVEAWSRRSSKFPTTIILDTTFVANRFPIKEFLQRLEPRKPRIVIQISSTLKLDQEGLEFSNSGLMSLYSTTHPVVTSTVKFIRKYRMMMGVGLLLDQIAALDYPGFLDKDLCEEHSRKIFENNALLARKLETGSDLLFKAGFHPSLEKQPDVPYAVAPFVNVMIDTDSKNHDRELLKYVLNKGSERRGLAFQLGSSFGFRGHRCETGIQNEQGIQIIRVAMGCRNGPSLQGTIDFLNEISRLGLYQKLRDKYPELAKIARERMSVQP